MNLIKSFNEYELRFLSILLDKKRYDVIEHLQEVQGMSKKKVFVDDIGLIFEKVKIRKKKI